MVMLRNGKGGDEGGDGDDGGEDHEESKDDSAEDGFEADNDGVAGDDSAIKEIARVAIEMASSDCRVGMTMDVPGVGSVRKEKICAWLNSGTATISSDIGLRFEQVGNSEIIANRSRFDIMINKWSVL